MPRVDSDAVFAALLCGDEHGYWRIAPVGATETGRAYRQGTFILDTDWAAPEGAGRSTDFLTRQVSPGHGVSLVREITCTAGQLAIGFDPVMRFDNGQTVPWVRRCAGPDGAEVVHALARPHALTLRGPSLKVPTSPIAPASTSPRARRSPGARCVSRSADGGQPAPARDLDAADRPESEAVTLGAWAVPRMKDLLRASGSPCARNQLVHCLEGRSRYARIDRAE